MLKKWFKRLVGVDALLSVGQAAGPSVAAIATLLGAALASFITWWQGAMAQFGFAGYVMIALIIVILALTAFGKLATLVGTSASEPGDAADEKDVPWHRTHVYIDFDVAVDVYKESQFTPSKGAGSGLGVLKLVEKRDLEVKARQIAGETGDKYSPWSYGPDERISPELAARLEVEPLDEEHMDYLGRYTLRDPTTERRYHRIRVNLVQLAHLLNELS